MFGWLRKRRRADEAPPQVTAEAPAPAPAPAPEPAPIVAAPALRPSMPLSSRPNVVGLELAEPDRLAPRLLDPAAALTPEAREELTILLTDMFGARGRYRLEWRPDRVEGDDAMFSEIMVADLVRRIQNAIAQVAELEQPAPFRAIEAAPAAQQADTGVVQASAPDAQDEAATEEARPTPEEAEAARMAAIDEFFSPAPTLEDIAAALQPDPDALRHDTHDVEGDRRIA